jgi:hypothetical protein
MKITTIDKGTAEAITSRLHDAVRDVADSMGVTVYVERAKFSTAEMSVTSSIKLPADKTEFPHYVYDGFAEREGVEFDGHFVGSRYKVKIRKSSEEVTVIGVDSKARKYKVNIELADGRRYRIVPAALKGRLVRAKVPPKEAFVTWCTFDGYDDRLDSDGVDRWDAVEEYMNKTFGEARLAVMRSLLEKFRAMKRSLDSRTAGVILKVYVLALNPKNISLLPAAVEALRKAISE